MPLPFKSITKIIEKLIGAPSSTITKWCKEEDKEITPNPLEPSEKKTIKDKKYLEIQKKS